MSPTPCHLRGADKYTAVANELRRLIATGKIAPGSQLPPRTELEETFQVSRVTLQRAMNLLIEDGFITATRSKGSFVSERPPHTCRYALVFQAEPERTAAWSRFWMAMTNEAARQERSEGCAFPTFYGIDGHTDTADYQNLVREIEEHRVAGVIYIADYPRLPNLSFLRDCETPAVLVSSPYESVADTFKGSAGVAASVMIDEESFIVKALDYLRKQGRRRVAFLVPSEYMQRRGEFLLQESAARDMRTDPFWIQGISLEAPFVARNCVHLLVNSAQKEIPDALVITDDNLVESATVGLVAAGIAVPRQIEVIAHANFPWKTPCVVPAHRLGYDVRAFMNACLDSIDRQRRGERCSRLLTMLACFEDELCV